MLCISSVANRRKRKHQKPAHFGGVWFHGIVPHDTGVVEVLPSLLDFRPAAFGLPEFEDQVAGAVVLHPPWRIKGTVVKGFGRGSKARARTYQND